MLILHTSDWHFGRTLHGADLGDSVDAFIDWLADLVVDRGVDAVFISGDVFDRSVPPLNAITRLTGAVSRLCPEASVVMTSGNHDGPVRLGMMSGMLRDELRVVTDPLSVGTAVEVGGDHGVLVYPVPYLEPDLVRHVLSDSPASDGSEEPEPLERSHQAVIEAACRRIRADLSRRRDAGDGRAAIAMVHAFITGAHPSDSERDIQVGGVPSVSADVFDSLGSSDAPLAHGLDYVAAGHLHRPQNVAGASVPIRYAGSPIAYSFSEAGAEKSVTLLEFDETSLVSVQTIPIPALHPVIVLEGPLDELLAGADVQPANAYCSVTVTDDARPERMSARVREAFPGALVIAHRSPVAPSYEAVRASGARRDSRAVSLDFFESAGGRPLDEEETMIVSDTWTALRTEARA